MVKFGNLPFWLFQSHAKSAACLSLFGCAGSSVIIVNTIDEKTKTTDKTAKKLFKTSSKLFDYAQKNIIPKILENPNTIKFDISSPELELSRKLKKLPSNIKKINTNILENLTNAAIKSHLQRMNKNFDAIADFGDHTKKFFVGTIPSHIIAAIEWFDKNWRTKTIVEVSGSFALSLKNSPEIAESIKQAFLEDPQSFYNFFKNINLEKIEFLLACSKASNSDAKCTEKWKQEIENIFSDNSPAQEVVENEKISTTTDEYIDPTNLNDELSNNSPITSQPEDISDALDETSLAAKKPSNKKTPTKPIDGSDITSSEDAPEITIETEDEKEEDDDSDDYGDEIITNEEDYFGEKRKTITIKNSRSQAVVSFKKTKPTDKKSMFYQLFNFLKNWTTKNKDSDNYRDLKDNIRDAQSKLEEVLNNSKITINNDYKKVLSFITVAVGAESFDEHEKLLVGQFFGNLAQYGNPIGETESVKTIKSNNEFVLCPETGKFVQSKVTAFGFYSPTCSISTKMFTEESQKIKEIIKNLNDKIKDNFANKLAESVSDSGGFSQEEKDRRFEEVRIFNYTMQLFKTVLENT